MSSRALVDLPVLVAIGVRPRQRLTLGGVTLGSRPHDVRTILLWQATFIAGVGTLLDDPVVPSVALLVIVSGTFLGCNPIALVAGRGTRRADTVRALQGE